jgi:hypothetical protein
MHNKNSNSLQVEPEGKKKKLPFGTINKHLIGGVTSG